MKLLVAIVQNADASALREELNRNEFSSTRLASTGGFLREGSTTFLIGVEEEKVERVKEIIGQTCKERDKLMPTHNYLSGEGIFTEPMEVTVGGAVVFVLPLNEIVKL